MDIDNFAEPEVAITAALTAAICSPRARKVMRQGLVYGIAGVLVAGDMATSLAKSFSQGIQRASEAALQESREIVAQEQERERLGEEQAPKQSGEESEKPLPATKRKQAKITAGAGKR